MVSEALRGRVTAAYDRESGAIEQLDATFHVERTFIDGEEVYRANLQ